MLPGRLACFPNSRPAIPADLLAGTFGLLKSIAFLTPPPNLDRFALLTLGMATYPPGRLGPGASLGPDVALYPTGLFCRGVRFGPNVALLFKGRLGPLLFY